MKKYVVFVFCFLFTLIISGQQRGRNIPKVSVMGKVIDQETKKALEYATIVFVPVRGRAITGGITDENGQFDISVSKGTYNISVEFISFKTKTFKNRKIDSSIDFGTISLEINTEAFDEVEIIAEKSTVEIRLDKKIYNVGKDMTVKGGTASDVLDNVPSVSVDVEGNVSLRGNENVRILVDGKPSGLIGLTGTDALRQLPAEAIEKVEVITSPSARYDAEGTAGILNIILRKGKTQGFNGSVTLTAGNPDNFGGSVNLNYKTEKLNLFTNTGYSLRKSPGNSFSNVTYFNDLGLSSNFRNEKINYDRESKRYNTLFGIEFLLTEKSSVTATFLYRNSEGIDTSENLINLLDQQESLTNTAHRVEEEDENDTTTEFALNYSKQFNRSGHSLTMDFQIGSSEEDNFTFIEDYQSFPTTMENAPERNSTQEKDKSVLFKGDYVLPIGKEAQFEFGFKFDIDELYSDYLVEDYSYGQFVNNTNFSNTLDFKQNVYGVYSQFGKKINRFSYLLGLRMEKTERKINLLQTDEVFNSNFTKLFPTINLGFEFSDEESLTLGYSRRLRRPRHWFLNPFESRTSETYIRKGNINLDPTYTNSFDLGYLRKWNNFTFNSSLYFQQATNNIEMVQTEEIRDVNNVETLVIIRTPVNLSTQNRYGFEFTANYNPFKWWRLSNSFNFFKSVTEGQHNNVSYDSDDVTWFTRFTSRITLPGNIDWETRGMYRAPRESAQSKRKATISINLAFSKDILKEKGTLSLNVSDLFNTRKRKSTTVSPSTYTIGEFQWRQRQILLNFTYRFNQKKKRERSQREFDGGGDEEMF